MKILKPIFLKYKYLLLVIAFSLLATFDLTNYGIPPTHDGEYHVLRFEQFYKTLSSGVLFPRWAPDFNNGFGIPIFNYVYPLPNYIASLFHFLGFGFIESFKLNMALTSLLGAVFMFLWAKKNWGEMGGAISSIFYTFSPYHFLNIYVRGSAGEVWSLALAPALLWSYYNFIETKKKLYFFSTSIIVALIIFAHNILAMVFFGFFTIYATFLMLNSKKKITELKSFALIIFIGLGIASPFWMPALIETKFVQGLQIANPTDHFPKLYQLIYSSWGYGFSGVEGAGQMSFQIGLANLIVLFFALPILFFSKFRKLAIFFGCLFVFCVFLITPYSSFFWDNIPLINYVQYPWRLLSLVILITAFLAGSLMRKSLFKNKKVQIITFTLLIIMCVALSINYARAPFYHQRNDSHYLTRSNFTDGTNSPGDAFNTIWLNSIPKKENEKIIIISGDGVINIRYIKPEKYIFNTNSSEPLMLKINTAYFPGWKTNIDGKSVSVSNLNGSIGLGVSRGFHNIEVYFGATTARIISYIYFLISVILLSLLLGGKIAIIKK